MKNLLSFLWSDHDSGTRVVAALIAGGGVALAVPGLPETEYGWARLVVGMMMAIVGGLIAKPPRLAKP